MNLLVQVSSKCGQGGGGQRIRNFADVINGCSCALRQKHAPMSAPLRSPQSPRLIGEWPLCMMSSGRERRTGGRTSRRTDRVAPAAAVGQSWTTLYRRGRSRSVTARAQALPSSSQINGCRGRRRMWISSSVWSPPPPPSFSPSFRMRQRQPLHHSKHRPQGLRRRRRRSESLTGHRLITKRFPLLGGVKEGKRRRPTSSSCPFQTSPRLCATCTRPSAAL